MDQSLILRGTRDFYSHAEYKEYLTAFFRQINTGREKRLNEEMKKMRILPVSKLSAHKEIRIQVNSGSTINVAHNTYSVDSRLIKEWITVYLKADTLEIYYGSRKIDTFPRLRGAGNHKIDYRHIIDSLVRKPGAFENYRYRDDLFPTINFRMAYDYFKKSSPDTSSRKYLKILHLASTEGEEAVNRALEHILQKGIPLTLDALREQVKSQTNSRRITEVKVLEVDLKQYDNLMENTEALYG